MEDLEEAGVAFNRHIPVGMMVEVPAAVMMIEHFLKEVDFISIGTNDLVQYTLAVDRSNKEVADLYQACDPAVLRLIDMTLTAARSAGVPASICGQMSGIPHYAISAAGDGADRVQFPLQRDSGNQACVAQRDLPAVSRSCADGDANANRSRN